MAQNKKTPPTQAVEKKRKRLIVVLGMHRSGTSAVARSLQVMNVELGDNLMPALKDVNDVGFWEDMDICALNDELLSSIGSSWHHLSPIRAADVSALRTNGGVVKASALLQQKMSKNEIFGFKDPRTAKLFPFWKEVFNECQLNVSCVLVIRHPLSVVKSLRKRDNFDAEKSYFLWLNHVITSLAGSNDLKRVLVEYDRLMSFPKQEINRIANRLDLEIDSVELEHYASDFLDNRLRHTVYDLSDLFRDRACPPLVREIYTTLLDAASDRMEIGHSALQLLVEQWMNEYRRLESILFLVDKLSEKNSVSGQAIVERDTAVRERDIAVGERDIAVGERDTAIAFINLLKQSASWRLTRPLRFLARLIRYGLTDDDRRKFTDTLRNRYHRLPLPIRVKRLVSFAYHQIIRKAVGSIRRSALRITQFTPPAIQPTKQQQGKPDYIIWGLIDWHFRHQRPQQLALQIAATGRRVFYISSSLVDDERAGFKVESLHPVAPIFQLKLFAQRTPSIYANAPSLDTVVQLRQSIGEVIAWADCEEIVCLVNHPFWCDIAAVVPNSRLIYDCMDHHQGFGNNSAFLLPLEKQLMGEAELTIVTSSWLENTIAPYAKQLMLIRNASDYEHFAEVPKSIYRDPKGRRVIGYYGAIAEWLDLDLLEAVAAQHPECCMLLIGADTINAGTRLSKLQNVTFTGEVEYSELPYYLHGFDVCLLPFKITPLTLATNPVKAYEYLSAGKPVVATDLPEMTHFEGLVYSVAGREAFLATLYTVLNQPECSTLIEKRKAFARSQTWQHRAALLIQHTESHDRDPKVSVIVVTYNNLDLTQACLSSLDEQSQYEQLEIIVVDNASSDGSPAFLSEWAAGKSNRSVILNEENKGFAAANNQGLEHATGHYLVLLNNDTYVTLGWIRTLIRHLERDQTIGLIGPVTNNIGNEAKIDIAYKGMSDMLSKSAAYTRRHVGQIYPLRTAAFFCVMMSRITYERVGKLNEIFGQGFFEDDDYCRRIEQLGLRVVCAEDVFIHHNLSASFSKLKQQDRQQLFEQNKVTYEARWGKWIPHSYRSNQSALQRKLEAIPDIFAGQKHISGECIICGRASRFFYSDAALWRESLNCEHCYSTSRYRSIAKGVLRAISELTGKQASSLATLSYSGNTRNKRLSIYDTQPSFYSRVCAYPIPDFLKKAGWINIVISQYKPKLKLGSAITNGIVNQNLECLTFPDESFDIVITSDVMEHVRLDDRAHREIYRVLRPGGVYLFTVPYDGSWEKTLIRVQINDPDNPSKDVHLLEPEYHGDTNSDEGNGTLAYRTYGKDLETSLVDMGFIVEYENLRKEGLGIMNTELFYCTKAKPVDLQAPGNVH